MKLRAVLQEAKLQEGARLDKKLTAKATQGADGYLYTRVLLQSDAFALLPFGWEFVSDPARLETTNSLPRRFVIRKKVS